MRAGEAEATVATFPVIDGVRWAVLGGLAKVGDSGLIVALGCAGCLPGAFVPQVVRAPTGKAGCRWSRAVLQAAPG